MKRLSTLAVLMLIAASLFASGENEGGKTAVAGVKISAPGVLPVVESKVTLRALVPQRLAGVPDWSTNKAILRLEELTNVHLTFDVAPDFQQAISLSVASGDLPDVVLGTIPGADVMLNGPRGIYQSLSKLIDAHGVQLKRIFATEPWIKDLITAPDGNIYTTFWINDDLHGVYGTKTWINKGWLDKLGLKLPETTEDFYNVLMAFKTRDPNGNGKADEIPYSGAMNVWSGPIPGAALNGFVYVNRQMKGLRLNKGKVEYSLDKPEYREGLRYYRRLYADGLLDPAAFTQTADQLQQLGENPGVEILGAADSGFWQGFTINGGSSGRYKNYTLVPPLKGPNGFVTTQYFKYAISRYEFAITKACKLPEVAIKWVDFLYTREGSYTVQYGPENVGWAKPPAGAIGINGKPALYVRLSPQEANNINLGGGGPRYLPKDERLGEIRAEGEEIWMAAKLMTRLAGMEVLTKYVGKEPPDDQIFPPVFLGEKQMADIKMVETSLENYTKESAARFIIGEMELDRDWQKYLDELQKIGLAKWLSIYQEAYDAQFKRR